MKFCSKCNVQIRGTQNVCPLCQAQVTGESEKMFPEIGTAKQSRFKILKKLILFATIAVCVLSAAVNLMIPQSGMWAHFVAFGAVCFFIITTIAFRRLTNISKHITYLTLVFCIFSILWDYVTGWHNWSFDYAVPMLCSAALISVSVTNFVLKVPPKEYILSLFTDVLLGLAPIALYLTGNIRVVYPTFICIALSAVLLAGLLLFEGRSFYAELKKKSHL